jgi:uncharacterized phiE125 gp8 family phage protein
MALKLITPPETLPITLTEAKAQLAVDFNDHDDLIRLLMGAAVGYCDGPEGFLERALVDQTWDVVLDGFPNNEIRIPLPPLIEVVGVFYDDGAGNEQSVAPDAYTVDSANEPGWVLPTSPGSWPSTFSGINSVRVRFRAGYVDNSTSPATGKVPDDLKQAILLYVGTLYAQRETVVVGNIVQAVPWSAEQLLRRKKIGLSLA